MFPITIRKYNRLPNRLNFDYIFNTTSFDDLKIMEVETKAPKHSDLDDKYKQLLSKIKKQKEEENEA